MRIGSLPQPLVEGLAESDLDTRDDGAKYRADDDVEEAVHAAVEAAEDDAAAVGVQRFLRPVDEGVVEVRGAVEDVEGVDDDRDCVLYILSALELSHPYGSRGRRTVECVEGNPYSSAALPLMVIRCSGGLSGRGRQSRSLITPLRITPKASMFANARPRLVYPNQKSIGSAIMKSVCVCRTILY